MVVDFELLSGSLTGIYDPHGMGSMLFAVLAVAAQLDRDYIREKTLEGQLAAAARGNHGGRPKVIDPDMAIVARALRDQGTPIPDIAQNLKIQSGKNAGKHPRSHPSTAPWPKPTRNTSPPARKQPLLPAQDPLMAGIGLTLAAPRYGSRTPSRGLVVVRRQRRLPAAARSSFHAHPLDLRRRCGGNCGGAARLSTTPTVAHPYPVFPGRRVARNGPAAHPPPHRCMS